MKAAFYKATRPGLQGLYSRAARAVDRGPYSHCELVFSDGLSGSASYIDGGVRLKRIDFDPEHWDFIELPAHLEPAARARGSSCTKASPTTCRTTCGSSGGWCAKRRRAGSAARRAPKCWALMMHGGLTRACCGKS